MIGAWADTALMILIIGLILWILRRQGSITDSISKKMDHFNMRIDSVNKEVVGYRDSWEKRKDGMLETFNRICHERQIACGEHIQTKLTAGMNGNDAKIKNIETRMNFVCTKIDDIKKQREKSWERQADINQKLLSLPKNRNAE